MTLHSPEGYHRPEDMEIWIGGLVRSTVRRTMAEQFGSYVDPEDLEQHLHTYLVAKQRGPWARNPDPKHRRYQYLEDVLENEAQDYSRDMRTQAVPGTPPRWVKDPVTLRYRHRTLDAMQQEFWHPGRRRQPLGHDGAAETAHFRYGIDPDRLAEVADRVPDKQWIVVAAKLNGASMREIADYLDIPESSARNRYHAALDRIGNMHGVVGARGFPDGRPPQREEILKDQITLPTGDRVARVVEPGDRVTTAQDVYQLRRYPVWGPDHRNLVGESEDA